LNRRKLSKPLGQQKTASGKERVQALYLLKTKQVEVQHLAVVLGRNRVSTKVAKPISGGGLNQLLEVGKVQVEQHS